MVTGKTRMTAVVWRLEAVRPDLCLRLWSVISSFRLLSIKLRHGTASFSHICTSIKPLLERLGKGVPAPPSPTNKQMVIKTGITNLDASELPLSRCFIS
jgi:hypothetical protein